MTKVKTNSHKNRSRKKTDITEATPKNQQNTTILEEEEEINSGFSSYLRSGEGIKFVYKLLKHNLEHSGPPSPLAIILFLKASI